MADRYYTAIVGADTPTDVTEGAAATPANFIDVRMTYDAIGASKMEAIKALDAIRDYITQDNFPPA